MSVYSHPITTDIHDVDADGVCRASSLLRYIQSAAQLQLTECGLSYEELLRRRRIFVLSRIRAEFSEPVRAFEPLVASTFPAESRGFSFYRCYTLSRPDGEIVGRAMSVWALLDTETRGLVRVSDFAFPITTEAPIDLSLDAIKMPSTLAEVGIYPVLYDDADQNRHMNNTRYPDLFAAFLPMEGKRIDAISIHYRKEAPLGERLRVLRAEEDGKYYFRVFREDGEISTDAVLTLCDI